MDEKALRHKGRMKAIAAMFTLALIIVAELVGVIIVLFANISDESLWSFIIPELTGAMGAIAAVAILGGSSWILLSWEDVRFTFRFGWWCLALSAGIMVLDFASYAADGTPLDAHWTSRLIETALFCLAIGILEEFMFRGVVFNGLLAAMGGTHRGVLWAVGITSLVFGMAHVDVTTDFVNGLATTQALLKIVQTGLYSLLLCVIALRTRKLGGVSLFHGLDDFVIIAPGIGLFGDSAEIEYVTTGDDALPSILYYLVIIALYMPFVIKSLRELRHGQDVYRGAFMERAVAQEQERAQSLAAVEQGAVVPPVYAQEVATPPVYAPLEPVAATEMIPAHQEGEHQPINLGYGYVPERDEARTDSRPPAPHGL